MSDPIIFLLILLFVLVFLLPSGSPLRGSKGERGERRVRKIIGDTIPGERYVINDLVLRTEEGKTAQIDHVLINPRGVFVIETKNYAGRIYGSADQLQWTQVLAYGRSKHKFYNPVKQNQTHIYHISKILSRKAPLKSVVVFVQGNIRFINAPCVCGLNGLKRVVGCGSPVLSDDRMKEIFDELTAANDITVSKSEHIENIRETKRSIACNICPRCGLPLVLKKGKFGCFYGCSGYPKCRFIKKK